MLLELIVLGVIAYLVDAYVPMEAAFKTVFRIICVVVAIVLLMQFLGVSLPDKLR